MSENKKEDLSEVQDIQEFVVSSDKTRSERKQAERASLSAITAWSSRKKAVAVLVAFVVLALIYVLVGILACKVNPVVVCLLLMIQVAIGVLLDQNPIWLHSCVVVAAIIVGICVGQTLLMTCAALVYVGAIVTLEVLQRLGIVAVTK
jgi:hypothetical protein